MRNFDVGRELEEEKKKALIPLGREAGPSH
jgi:hypothetical protein